MTGVPAALCTPSALSPTSEASAAPRTGVAVPDTHHTHQMKQQARMTGQQAVREEEPSCVPAPCFFLSTFASSALALSFFLRRQRPNKLRRRLRVGATAVVSSICVAPSSDCARGRAGVGGDCSLTLAWADGRRRRRRDLEDLRNFARRSSIRRERMRYTMRTKSSMMPWPEMCETCRYTRRGLRLRTWHKPK